MAIIRVAFYYLGTHPALQDLIIIYNRCSFVLFFEYFAFNDRKVWSLKEMTCRCAWGVCSTHWVTGCPKNNKCKELFFKLRYSLSHLTCAQCFGYDCVYMWHGLNTYKVTAIISGSFKNITNPNNNGNLFPLFSQNIKWGIISPTFLHCSSQNHLSITQCGLDCAALYLVFLLEESDFL